MRHKILFKSTLVILIFTLLHQQIGWGQVDVFCFLRPKAFADRNNNGKSELKIGPPIFNENVRAFIPLRQIPVNVFELFDSYGISQDVASEAAMMGFTGDVFSNRIDLYGQHVPASLQEICRGSITQGRLTPFAKAPPSIPGVTEKTVPRAKGRGYVEEGLLFVKSDENDHILEPTLSVQFKGAGKSGYIESQSYVDPEKVWGVFTDEQIVNDLAGEIVARKANLSCPKTVVLAEWQEFYNDKNQLVAPSQIRAEEQPSEIITRLFFLGRAWEDGTRVWDFTVSPQRNGLEIDQAIMGIPLPLEFYYALRYGDEIQTSARQAVDKYLDRTLAIRSQLPQVRGNGVGYRMLIEQLGLRGKQRYEAYIESMQEQIYDYLIGVIRHRIWLAPYALHMANVSIAGQFSGFDRILGYADTMNQLRSGLASAFIDTYSALNLLSVILCQKYIAFNNFFHRFQDRLRESQLEDDLRGAVSGASFIEFVDKGLESSSLDSILHLEGYPFSVRHENDVASLLNVLETTFLVLERIYSSNINDVGTLEQIVEAGDHPNFYRVTATQLYGGMSVGNYGGLIDELVQRREKVTQEFRELLWGASTPSGMRAEILRNRVFEERATAEHILTNI